MCVPIYALEREREGELNYNIKCIAFVDSGKETLKANIEDPVRIVSSRYHRLTLRMDDRAAERKGDCGPKGPFH